MWPDVVTEALLIAVVGGLVAIVVELIRNRRRQDKVVHEVSPNSGSSMKDALGRIEANLTDLRAEVDAMRTAQARNGERLAALEAVASVPTGVGTNGRRWFR